MNTRTSYSRGVVRVHLSRLSRTRTCEHTTVVTPNILLGAERRARTTARDSRSTAGKRARARGRKRGTRVTEQTSRDPTPTTDTDALTPNSEVTRTQAGRHDERAPESTTRPERYREREGRAERRSARVFPSSFGATGLPAPPSPSHSPTPALDWYTRANHAASRASLDEPGCRNLDTARESPDFGLRLTTHARGICICMFVCMYVRVQMHTYI